MATDRFDHRFDHRFVQPAVFDAAPAVYGSVPGSCASRSVIAEAQPGTDRSTLRCRA